MSEADLLLAVGTKLGPSDTLRGSPGLIDPQRQTLVQIDAEPLNLGWTFPVQHGLVADADCAMGPTDGLVGRSAGSSDHGSRRAGT